MGLRGIAILMVILFHLRADYFSQGFLGVDVFLVISGFLLFRGYKSDFKILPFIQKKVLRIIPLLAIVVIITAFIVFPVLFSTKSIEDEGACSISSLFCLSNIHYIHKYSDYFSTNANLNPLLHTWYLSLVVQIYAIWAIGCFCLKKTNRVTRIITVVVAAVVSIIYFYSLPIHDYLSENNLPVWTQTKSVSYYDTIGRIWQVAAGALICILPRAKDTRINLLAAGIGVGVLLYALLRNTEEPLSGALLTVMATVLTLTYIPGTKIRLLLENKAVMWIGKISFSLYLIHFPLIVIYKRYSKELPNLSASMILLLAMLILAWLLWFFIEKRKYNLVVTSILILAAVSIGSIMRLHTKLGIDFFRNSNIQYPSYNLPTMPEHVRKHLLQGYDETLLIADGGVTGLHQNDFRITSGEQAEFIPLGHMNQMPEFVVVGDSHAQQMYAGFNELCKTKNINGVFLSSVVLPYHDLYHYGSPSYCWDSEKYYAFLNWLKEHPEIHTIVIGHHWESALAPRSVIAWDMKKYKRTRQQNIEHLKHFFADLKQIGKQVIVLTHAPVLLGFENAKDLDQGLEYARWRHFRYGTAMPMHDKDPIILTQEMHTKEYQDATNALYMLENEGYCRVLDLNEIYFSKGPILLYSGERLNFRDRGHITPPFSVEVLAQISDTFLELLKTQRAKVRNQDRSKKNHTHTQKDEDKNYLSSS